MNLDSSEYEDALEEIKYYLSDLEAFVSSNKKSKYTYTVFQIPEQKDNSCSVRYHVVGADGLISYAIFKSTQSMGIMAYFPNGTENYSYAIRQKNGQQDISFNFYTNNKGYLRNFKLDSKKNRYIFNHSIDYTPIEHLDNYDIHSIADYTKDTDLLLMTKYTIPTTLDGFFAISSESAIVLQNKDGNFKFLKEQDYPDLTRIFQSDIETKTNIFEHCVKMENLFSNNAIFKKINNIIKFYLNLSKESKDIEPEL